MVATVTTFGEWHDSEGDPWDAARDAFYPDFDCDAGAAPAAVLKSSLYPNAPLARNCELESWRATGLATTATAVRTSTAEWNLLRKNKS